MTDVPDLPPEPGTVEDHNLGIPDDPQMMDDPSAADADYPEDDHHENYPDDDDETDESALEGLEEPDEEG